MFRDPVFFWYCIPEYSISSNSLKRYFVGNLCRYFVCLYLGDTSFCSIIKEALAAQMYEYVDEDQRHAECTSKELSLRTVLLKCIMYLCSKCMKKRA